ncbi:MAG: hypothetical protein E6Q97_16140 [Desulfurellales bacterium]|nr:MAG: hypothetical protein E6Q97_16140 [Desulfurellales bacterium]
MGEVNAELVTTMAGRRVKGRKIEYAWEACSAEQFIDYWLPLFESGQMRPEDAPVVRMMCEVDAPKAA